ncbi:MAG: hypothetical protein WD824_06095 [Cyclobacteriaceae bacterium]
MKKKLITFVTVFVGNFALSYFFIEERDIPSFLFVSAGAAAFVALTEDYQLKLVVRAVKKIVKPR